MQYLRAQNEQLLPSNLTEAPHFTAAHSELIFADSASKASKSSSGSFSSLRALLLSLPRLPGVGFLAAACVDLDEAASFGVQEELGVAVACGLQRRL